MNKTELIAAIAEKAALTKADAQKALNAFTETVAACAKKGEEVRILGFGTFSVVQRPAREGVNPRKKGEKIHIPARKVVKFKAGAGLDLKKAAPAKKKK